jgi:hypothetical protein
VSPSGRKWAHRLTPRTLLTQQLGSIRAEELRGQPMRFYVKQVETGDAGDFSRMSDEELRAYVNGEKLPPKGETKH